MIRRAGTAVQFAFTLVELLVVIAIIAVLIAMMLPAVKKAKDNMRLTQCGTQQHQLHIGTIAFANDHKGYLIRHPKLDASAGGPSNIFWDPNSAHSFVMSSGTPDTVYFLPYFNGARELFFCPSSPVEVNGGDANVGWGWPSPLPGYSNWVFTTLINLANINPIDGTRVAQLMEDDPSLGLWTDNTAYYNFHFLSANHPAFYYDDGYPYNFGLPPADESMVGRNLARLGGDVLYARFTTPGMKFRTQLGATFYLSY